MHAPFALERLNDESRESPGGEFKLQRGEIPERHRFGAGQHRAEMLAPERIAHDGKSAASEAVEPACGIEQTIAARMGARELDGGFNALAPGTAEKRLLHASARAPAELVRQLAGQLGSVTL